ncbi:MAG: DEAD/DEAH box helicase [Metamycoplasmataceae bacterium]
MIFKDIKQINENVMKSLEEMGFTEATPIQRETFKVAFDGKDIIGQAQTGTGKTGAFGIPIVNMINEDSLSIEHLIIAPTRELASQIHKGLKNMGKFSNAKVCLILGGSGYDKQARDLKDKPHIVVATPGRINDLLNSGKISLNNIKTFTLDEADELLNIGFQKDIENIITYLPKVRQNFFFTATFNKKTRDLAALMTKDPININVSEGLKSATTLTQELVVVREGKKLSVLMKFLELYKPKSVVIFGRTKRRVDELNEALNQSGYSSAAIQGNMEQRERTFVMDKFRNHAKTILVATDVMARGIDVEHVEWVVNFDLPQEIEYYTHRIGRAGRAGRKGYALSLVKPEELEHIKEICFKTGSVIEEIQIPSDMEIRDAWKAHLSESLREIVDAFKEDDSEYPTYLEKELLRDYTPEELSILLAKYILDKKTSSAKLTLTPEPAVASKGNRGRNRSNGHRDRRGGGSRGNFNTNGGNFGGERRSYSRDRQSSNGERRTYGGGDRQSSNGERRTYGGDRQSSNGERRSYNGDRNNFVREKRSYGDRNSNLTQNPEKRHFRSGDRGSSSSYGGERKSRSEE